MTKEHTPGASAAECDCAECRESVETFRPQHQHEVWQIRATLGGYYCAACGATL